tara:strand:+ start:82 stop:774 length:693 start_codon:yes stop_codon:yes gene_type:complete
MANPNKTKVFLPKDLIVRNDNNPVAQQDIINQCLSAITALTGKTIEGGWIGVEAEKTGKAIRLIPSINGTSLAHLKAEFTFYIELLGQIALANHLTFAKAKNAEGNELLSIMADDATLKIESIGARTTNWDTGYNLIISNIDPDEAKEIIEASIRIKGESKYSSTNGYALTTRQDVKRFCELTGNADLFNRLVAEVKEYECQHDLKSQQADNGGRIDPAKSLTIAAALAA